MQIPLQRIQPASLPQAAGYPCWLWAPVSSRPRLSLQPAEKAMMDKQHAYWRNERLAKVGSIHEKLTGMHTAIHETCPVSIHPYPGRLA